MLDIVYPIVKGQYSVEQLSAELNVLQKSLLQKNLSGLKPSELLSVLVKKTKKNLHRMNIARFKFRL